MKEMETLSYHFRQTADRKKSRSIIRDFGNRTGRANRWKILQLPSGNMDMRKKSSEGTRINTVSYPLAIG